MKGCPISILGLACAMILCAAPLTPAEADSLPPVRLGELKILTLPPSFGSDATSPAIEVVSADESGLSLEFELPSLEVQETEVGSQTYQTLGIEGGAHRGALGEPMLPTFSRLVAIPDRASVSVGVVATETTEIAGYRPTPLQPLDADEFVVQEEAYARSGYDDAPPVLAGDPALARNLRVVPITFQPVRFDPSRETLEIAHRIRVEVSFTGEDLRNVPQRRQDRIPPSFDRLYRRLVVNYDGPRAGQVISRGSYVIICPGSGSVLSAIQPLVDWRTRQGFDVYVATTLETGSRNTEIQAWLRNAYNTWDNPPEYITLVGDVAGRVAVSHWVETISGDNGETDFPYVQLDGDDVLADAHIGRISVETIDQLELCIHKLVSYERTPYMDETDWYPRACLVGDSTGSGPTCVQLQQWLKEGLLDFGYTEVDTVFHGPWVYYILDRLNRGDTIFSWRGTYGMSGIDVDDILTLENGWKLPFAVHPTCDSGSFAQGTARSEAWLRAGLPPDIATGGIGAIATSSLGTHTRYNNCLTYGIWRAPFWEDLYRLGETLTRGRYELYVNYAVPEMIEVWKYTYWANLMGDAATELWTGIPREMAIDHPTGLAVGANSVTVTVTDDGGPCNGAYVCLWKGEETHIGGVTGADGTVELPVSVPTEGEMAITVTMHDHHPYLGWIPVSAADLFVGYRAHSLDDDENGTSSGNGDGQANPTESLEIPVEVENFGTLPASQVTGTLSTTDPYVVIVDGEESFGDVAGGASTWSVDDFDITIDGGAPSGHEIQLALDLASGEETWHSLITIPIASAAFAYDDLTHYDFGSEIEPGESGEISVLIRNVGTAAGADVTGTLVSESEWVVVTDDQGAFGGIPEDASGENTTDRFGLSISGDCFNGHLALLTLYLDFSGGARDTLSFALPVGQVTTDDPTGPDTYGYYAFDDGDAAYDYAPTYDWIEIDPAYGGQGSAVGLTDFGWGQDASRTVALPFPFTYYGQTFTSVTICSNGWIAMGATYLTNYRNWNIPAAGAPPNLIAPMWDNLRQEGSNQVYHWYDATHHRYVIEWSRLRNEEGDAVETFEVILYDAAHHPTLTGDGIIVFQYDTFNNSDALQHYSTIGIQNADCTDGVMYGYHNYYNAGAREIESGRAVQFGALDDSPRGMLSGTVTNLTDGTPLAGVEVALLESQRTLLSEPDGTYGGSVLVGTYTLVASHPGFDHDTLFAVPILEGESTIRDFGLIDIMPPEFRSTTELWVTTDTVGPYEVRSSLIEYSTLEELTLRYRIDGGEWVSTPFVDEGGTWFHAQIPGQPVGSSVEYYLYARDAADFETTDPPGAPAEAYAFDIVGLFYADDMEDGQAGWTHEVVTPDYVDQWHMSTRRNHTPDGSWSWKFGDTGDGDYAAYADGALISEPLEVEGELRLTFWQWMRCAIAIPAPYTFHGALVEMSIDGGPWNAISPVGGYPRLIIWDAELYECPFPPYTPVFGAHDEEDVWSPAEFHVGPVTGTVQFRWRFGSDRHSTYTYEGWHIDDVQLACSHCDVSEVIPIKLTPARVALHQNAPNPFRMTPAGATRIEFDLPNPSPVRLQILDVGGRLVQTLVDGELIAGRHRCTWDGRTAAGVHADCGVYFYRLEVGGLRQARQLLLLK